MTLFEKRVFVRSARFIIEQFTPGQPPFVCTSIYHFHKAVRSAALTHFAQTSYGAPPTVNAAPQFKCMSSWVFSTNLSSVVHYS